MGAITLAISGTEAEWVNGSGKETAREGKSSELSHFFAFARHSPGGAGAGSQQHLLFLANLHKRSEFLEMTPLKNNQIRALAKEKGWPDSWWYSANGVLSEVAFRLAEVPRTGTICVLNADQAEAG